MTEPESTSFAQSLSQRQIPELAPISTYAERIAFLDQLCLYGADTLVRTALKGSASGRAAFFPHLRQNTPMPKAADKPYLTTSAQCLSACHKVAAALDEMKLRTFESTKAPEIAHGATRVDHDEIKRAISGIFKTQLKAVSREGLRTKNKDVGLNIITSTQFGQLNPLTAAHVFRALTEQNKLLTPAWWYALFSIFWSLHRHHPAESDLVGAWLKNRPPSAYVTSYCFHAVFGFLQVLGRRHARLTKLTNLIRELEGLYENVTARCTDKENQSLRGLHSSIKHRILITSLKTRHLLDEMAADTTVSDRFIEASKRIGKFINEASKNELDYTLHHLQKDLKSVLEDISASFATFPDEGYAPPPSLGKFKNKKLRDALADGREPDPQDKELLPQWLASVENPHCWDQPQPTTESAKTLRRDYWIAMANSVAWAHDACVDVGNFYSNIAKAYSHAKDCKYRDPNDTARRSKTDGYSRLSDVLDHAGASLAEFRAMMMGHLRPATRCADVILDRQIAYWHTQSSKFDASELAHAVSVVVCASPMRETSLLIEALEVICQAQRSDGSWPLGQPFYWRRSGFSVHASSVSPNYS